MDNERPVPLCVRFLRTRHGVSRTHRARGRRTPEIGTGAQCAMLHPRPRARRLAAGSQLVCHVDFVLLRRRLTHPCRKPRVPRWSLHICVQSRAPGQNSSSYRSVRPNWLLNSPSFTWWSPWWVGDGRWQREVRSHCPLAIEFDKLRRRPRRDSHGTCRLSGAHSHLLGNDDTPCQWSETRKSTIPSTWL